ncbi:proline-rich domain-containing protein [uncultured Algibacter sp.]|uniref:proline-rich domain-containing protein n=1 Tax=uncultured Algibacter sp. TaxID=298659 RepID=UPI002607BD90|nr:proline-rich domain-containing protein [uncultured Algibacter sp.]
MKKNLLLYILLFFLIIVNAFFLFNYLGQGGNKEQNRPEKAGAFLIEELGFDKSQQEQFNSLEKNHHLNMRIISEDLRGLKDEFFKSLSDTSLKDVNIDSIALLIGRKEAAKDLEVYHYFNNVQELCNEKQKEIFSKIIDDALRGANRNQGPPPPNGRQEGDRQLPPGGREGNRPPPPGERDGNRPPPMN